MKEYVVTFVVTVSVEAKSEEEAVEIADSQIRGDIDDVRMQEVYEVETGLDE